MDYLVTGGAGFIGSNIVRRLLETGKSVRVLDNLATGRMRNIEALLGDLDFIEGDIRDAAVVGKAVDGVKNVLHLAALPSVVRSVEDPVTSNDVNVNGTLTVLMAARDAGVERFVFSSSSAVYGDTPILPKQEDMAPLPLSPYAVQKLAGECYCRTFQGLYGFGAFALRYFNVFGPRQNPKSQYSAVIPLFVDALKNDNPPTLHGDGGQTRDFTYVADVVQANIRCCEAPEEAAGDVYNVARGDRVSVKELAEKIAVVMGKDIKPSYGDPRPGDVRDSQADSTKARSKLGWCPEVTLEEGLKKTIDYFLNEE
ncbi:MAG: SDR family oxidoreductase [Kiritimatiellae bacterium]|nr:SDR family oxidoreductase [Kiritimatiellia bacterium]